MNMRLGTTMHHRVPCSSSSACSGGRACVAPVARQRPFAQSGSRAPTAAAASSLNGSSRASTTGVVIVDHGSRKAESNDMLFEFVELYKRMTGAVVVEVAHMELAEPTIEQAIGKCSAAGCSSVVVAPYFLSRGRHIQDDIPKLVSDAQALFPDVTCVVAEPIGIDPLMAQLISQRVEGAMGKLAPVAVKH
ncbi:hypothetical protein FOA52_010951 [Chlamydomonas sp. UWO 241]|nr:hypothetical protein FOA52_010951 [Chlamydomonas sp. UWO 241]